MLNYFRICTNTRDFDLGNGSCDPKRIGILAPTTIFGSYRHLTKV